MSTGLNDLLGILSCAISKRTPSKNSAAKAMRRNAWPFFPKARIKSNPAIKYPTACSQNPVPNPFDRPNPFTDE